MAAKRNCSVLLELFSSSDETTESNDSDEDMLPIMCPMERVKINKYLDIVKCYPDPEVIFF